MNWMIPGTVIPAERGEAKQVRRMFQSVFLAGDIALGQVVSISGLEPYIVQNWVKRGFLTPPSGKRYSMNQLCRILNINMLKGALAMDRICGLLGYINGRLDDESDDLVDDTELYFLFVELAARVEEMKEPEAWLGQIQTLLEETPQIRPEARQRTAQVLQVMLAAWVSTVMRQQAERMMNRWYAETPDRTNPKA